MYRNLAFLAIALFICCAQANGQEDPNLVGYWNFDDGTAADLSGNANNGTFVGNATLTEDPVWTFGGTGKSLDLNYKNRNSDWIEIPHSESLNITHELSVLLWVMPGEIENWDGLVCKGTTKCPWSLRFNEDHGLRFSINHWFNLDDPTDPNYALGAVGTGEVQSAFDVNEVGESEAGEWTYVGVISDTTKVRFIKNFEEEVIPIKLVFAEWAEPLYLGVHLPDGISNSSANIDYFNGLMDEVRIYNRAVSRRVVIAASGMATKPFEPVPADGAAGVTSGTLTWGRIEGTDKVYLGTDPGALALVDEGTDGTYTIVDIVPDQQYFWRVDVVTSEGVVTGDVWTFTLAGYAASIPAPSDGTDFVDVEGLSLAWAPAFGAKAYDVFFGTNPDALELLGQTIEPSYENPQKKLVSETVHCWRVDAVKDGGIVAGPTWSFKTMPVFTVEGALVGWYKFELGEGTTAVDWTRKGNDGFLVGDTQWIDDGYAGRALDFDGDGDYVQIPRVVENDWTIMLWLRTEDLTQGGGGNRFRTNSSALIDGDYGSQLENFAMTFKTGIIVAGCTTPGTGAAASLQSNTAIEDSDWHSVAWTRDAVSGEMALFIDGRLDASGTRTDNAWKGTKDAQDHIKIGLHDYSNSQGFFTGQLDEIKFFTRVLDEAEVQLEMRPDKRVAYSPQPVPGSVLDQEVAVLLVWEPGEGATAHNVYLGTSEDEMLLVGPAQVATAYDAGLLDPASYYWQIGEIQADGAEVKGEIWSFAVADYLIVDDFESYTDDDAAGQAIWQHWIDGFGVAENGSQVGNLLPPYAEQTIVHSGLQSMPLVYDNSGTAHYSEAERTFSSEQDWTRKGVKALSLWFRGYPASVGSFAEAPAGTYTMTAAGADIWGNADQCHFAFKTLTGAGSIAARVNSVENTHAWTKAGVMIRETLDAGSKHAFACITPSNGVSSQGRTMTAETSFSTTENGITAPHWVKLERDVAGNFTVSHSANGSTWQPVAGAIPTNIPMTSNVYIGLALTSHDEAQTCQAVFSNVITTGNISGQWAHQDIGILSNDPDPMYVAVSNGTGAPAVVYHDDPSAALIDVWTEWTVDLQRFADQGVDLARVNGMALGLGDGNNPQAGGSGKMHFDDIRLYR